MCERLRERERERDAEKGFDEQVPSHWCPANEYFDESSIVHTEVNCGI